MTPTKYTRTKKALRPPEIHAAQWFPKGHEKHSGDPANLRLGASGQEGVIVDPLDPRAAHSLYPGYWVLFDESGDNVLGTLSEAQFSEAGYKEVKGNES